MRRLSIALAVMITVALCGVAVAAESTAQGDAAGSNKAATELQFWAMVDLLRKYGARK